MAMDSNTEQVKNTYIKVFLVGLIPPVLLVWIISKMLDESFTTVLLFVAGAYIALSIYKAVITAITFRLFLKRDMVNAYLQDLRKHDFPEPESVLQKGDPVEWYFENIALDPHDHPRNVAAVAMITPITNARLQGQLLVTLRLNSVMREALNQYRREKSRR